MEVALGRLIQLPFQFRPFLTSIGEDTSPTIMWSPDGAMRLNFDTLKYALKLRALRPNDIDLATYSFSGSCLTN